MKIATISLTCCTLALTSAACAQRGEFLATGLSMPVDFASDPTHPSRFYIVQQTGEIRIIEDGGLLDKPFFEVNRDNFTGHRSNWERGLLGIALDPDFANNKRFYLNYTGRGGVTHVSRFTATDPHTAANTTEEIIITIEQPWGNHNGGGLAFGPDSMLYIGMGDGGAANDPRGAGQDMTTLLGKMLRIDVTSAPPDGRAYVIPSDNPFVNRDGVPPEIWSFGLRNPWRYSFDSRGRLWIADVGQNHAEWVHLQPEGSKGGENYGWNVYEGPEPFRNRPAGQRDIQPDPATIVLPVWSYTHRYNNRMNGSITGGFFYEGDRIPALRDRYICADFMSGRIWSFKIGSAGKADDIVEHTRAFAPMFEDRGPELTISSFGRDNDGELYILDLKAGTVIKIVP